MPIVKRRLTLDEIDALFEQYEDVDTVIKKFYKGYHENMPHAKISVLYQDDNTEITTVGHYIKPCNTDDHPVPDSIKGIKIYEALVRTRANENDPFEIDSTAICIQKSGCKLYYETESTIQNVIHNAYGISINDIERLRYNVYV